MLLKFYFKLLKMIKLYFIFNYRFDKDYEMVKFLIEIVFYICLMIKIFCNFFLLR